MLGDNGIVTYTPDAGFTGEDQFAYEVCSIDVVDETTTTTEATTTTTQQIPARPRAVSASATRTW